MLTNFWLIASRCQHLNLYLNYTSWGRCGTPYCEGWDEYHCKDCGVFVQSCPCGYNNGMSGWSAKMRRTYEKAKFKKAAA